MKLTKQPCDLLLQGFVVFILFISFALEADAKATKSVSLELKANWPQTPLPLEIGEFLASEDEELFWKFLDKLGKIRGITEEEQYTHAFEVATELLSDVQRDLLQYSLAIRYFSPRVQMYRQVYDLQLDELGSTTRNQLENQSGAWALFNNQIYSSPTALLEAIRKASSPSAPTIHEFDHVHPSSTPIKSASTVVVLYATIGTQPFLDFHSQLAQHLLYQDNTAYVLRHLVPSFGEDNLMNLAGYGVELDIKSLEYKAVDDSKVEGAQKESAGITEEDLTEDTQGFIFGKLQQRKPEYASELAAFKASLLANDVQFEELKQWQLKDIGYQAAQRITAASDPLLLMKELSQNFPTYAVSLSKVKLDPTFKSQLETNRAVEPGRSLVVINGRVVDPQTADPFQLFSILREELNKVDSLLKAYVPKDAAFKILSTPSEKSNDVYRIIDEPPAEGQTPAIIYINDLETDPTYASWPRSVGEIFRRVWPGSFRFIAKNLFTAVAFIDPSTFEGIFTGYTLEHLMTQQAPIRFAVVLMTQGYKESLNPDNFRVNDAVKAVRLFHYINSLHGPREAMGIFKYLRQYSRSSDQIIRNIVQGVSTLGLDMNHIETVILSNEYQEQYDHFAKRANQFAAEKGIKKTPTIFMNGALLNPDMSLEEIQGTIINSYFYHTHLMQQSVKAGEINNNMDIYSAVLGRPGVMPRYSDVIIPSQQNPLQFLSLSSESSQAALGSLKYFPNLYDEIRPISDHVIVDWRSPSGVRLAYYGMKYMMQSPTDTRLALVFNAPNPQPSDILLVQSVLAALQSQTSGKSIRFVAHLLEYLHNENEKGEHNDLYYLNGAQPVDIDRETINRIATEAEINVDRFQEAFTTLSAGAEVSSLLQAHKQYIHHITAALKLPNLLQNALISNGRTVLVQTRRTEEATVNPTDNYGSGLLFSHADFEFLSIFELNKRAKKIHDTLGQANFENVDFDTITPAFMSDIIMKATSVIGLDEQNNVEKIVIPQDLWTSFQIRSRNSTENWTSFRIYAIFNPISSAAQRFVPILQSLLDLFDIQLFVILNPAETSDLPLKNFYTYVLPSKVAFKPETGTVSPPIALLSNLPTSRLLTMKLDTPEAWFVTPTVARYDLDNIKLEDLNANNENILYAQLELQSIVVEGNCLDMTGQKSPRGGVPPRGLEVVLTDKFGESGDRIPTQTDTIVMSNLGYFQLKSNPGVWKLELRGGTKSSDLYNIIGEMDHELPHKTVMMSDFNGKFEALRVRKKSGREAEELLSGDNTGWNLSGFFGGKSQEEETIHVFSVATGHLYERFLKIMMLSVVKQTKSPVKFWLLANYLSPKFKEAIPHMAKHYNFEYELVTYKWPAWLHKQTEKQRIIWGYKILFLDVLFPLNVKKVIYVDADQVVRTDLKELWNMDLEGAPYGYTPFCSDRSEMDGFRFWKQGFWMNHLRGRPYHISALYVVDLVQFRKQGAGDTLRATYAQLAQDPNSLANLDQDLPNYLQHVVKIKSLPQEWLWCETWCSDESKPKAKTIDLCNNPLTKTPKLENAVRILAEWPDLDNEIKAFEKTVAQPISHPTETKEQHSKHKQVILEATKEILL